jgi:ATP-dependent RNA helicase DDX3X
MSNKKRDKEGRVRSKTVSSFSDDRLPSDLPPEKRQRITESLHDKITHTQQPETPEKTPTKPATSVIDFEKYENIPINIIGQNIPKAAETFTECNLCEFLKLKIKAASYDKPTPVQKNAIPIIMSGQDLMASAQTGSGKTAAFLFPYINSLLQKKPEQLNSVRSFSRSQPILPKALFMVPTRELALQIQTEATKFTSGSPIKCCVSYGGAPMGPQLRTIERGCHLLIATPGRLKDFIDRRRISLAEIEYLCLDEADRMLDMGFEPQIREIIQASDMPSREKRQTVMFSATFPKPIQNLARDFLRTGFVYLEVGRVGSTTDLIKQVVKEVFDKNSEILKDLNDIEGRTLVFAERKVTAEQLGRYLRSQGINATEIHGDRSQMEREAALRSFKRGVNRVLVATSVAARGLDIDEVKHVINYDLPQDVDDYVHRIGRTGRAGHSGVATSYFTTGDEKIASDLITLLTENNQEVPQFLYLYSSYKSSFSGRRRGGGGGRFGGRGGGRGGFGRGGFAGSGSYGQSTGGYGGSASAGGYSSGGYANAGGYGGHSSGGYSSGGGYNNSYGGGSRGGSSYSSSRW